MATASGKETSSASLALALTPATLLAGVAGGIAFPILPIVGLRLGLSLPFIGVILAAGNAVGGYVVTERMLKMFVSAGRKKGP